MSHFKLILKLGWFLADQICRITNNPNEATTPYRLHLKPMRWTTHVVWSFRGPFNTLLKFNQQKTHLFGVGLKILI